MGSGLLHSLTRNVPPLAAAIVVCADAARPNRRVKQTNTNALFTTVTRSFPDDLDQHAFLAPAVEFAVEDLFPGAEMKLIIGNRNDHLSAHDRAF